MHSKVHEIAYKDNSISWGAPSRTLASALKDSTLKAIDISGSLPLSLRLAPPRLFLACKRADHAGNYIRGFGVVAYAAMLKENRALQRIKLGGALACLRAALRAG